MTYTVTREKLEGARVELAKNNVHLVGDKGTLTASGLQLDFTYVDPTLTIEIAGGNFITRGVAEKKLNEYFK